MRAHLAAVAAALLAVTPAALAQQTDGSETPEQTGETGGLLQEDASGGVQDAAREPAAAKPDAPPPGTGDVEDQRRIIATVDALDMLIDAKKWSEARRLFTDEVVVDTSGLTGTPPSRMAADRLVGMWRDSLKVPKRSFHLRGNHQVSFEDGDRALVRSNGYAWNALGGKLWEVWGVWEHGLVRDGDAWKIDSYAFSPTRERGERL